jgi:hypothetical protein
LRAVIITVVAQKPDYKKALVLVVSEVPVTVKMLRLTVLGVVVVVVACGGVVVIVVDHGEVL